MKKDLLLIITGMFLGVTLSFFIYYLASNQFEAPTKPHDISKQQSIIPLDNTKHTPTSSSSKSKAIQQIETQTEKSLPSNTDSDDADLDDETDKLRTELVTQIHNLPDYKVKWVKEIVDQAEEPPVDKLFESELRDPDRAIGLEDKLRYDFYDQNALNGRGRLDSLECRSRYCKARIALPKKDPLGGAQHMINLFPGIVLSNSTLNTDNNSDENFTVIYIDTQPDSTMFIKIDDSNNP